MTEFIDRQLNLFQRFISEFRRGLISLNILIQKLKGLIDFIDINPLKKDLDALVQDAEMINAITIEKGGGLLAQDKVELNRLMVEMERLIRGYYQSQATEKDE